MIYKFVADIHLCSSHETPVDFTALDPETTVLLGDIVDLKGCKKKDVGYARELLIELWGKFPLHVSGNHELTHFWMSVVLTKVAGGLLVEHGDELFWGLSKSVAFRSQNAGRGFFGRLGAKALNKLRFLKKAKLSKDDLERVSRRALSMRVKKVVVAHKHPKKLLYYKYNGVKIWVVPPGLTKIDL